MIHILRVLEAAGEVQQFCRKQNWQFCFIGGLAVQRWGEPRMTQDAALTLLTGFGNEEKFTDKLLTMFPTRRPDARICAEKPRPADSERSRDSCGRCIGSISIRGTEYSTLFALDLVGRRIIDYSLRRGPYCA